MIWRASVAISLTLMGAMFASSARAEPTADEFITNISLILAPEPARAEEMSQAEIRRLTNVAAARGDGRLASAYWASANAKFRLGDQAGSQAQLATAIRLAPAGGAGRRLHAYIDLLEGLVARSGGDFGNALQEYRTAQTGFIAARDNRGQALALQSLGSLYADVGDSNNALRYLTLAEETYAGDDTFLFSLNNNFGVALQNGERHAEAINYFRRALSVSERQSNNNYTMQIRINMAMSQVQLGQFSEVSRTLAPVGPPTEAMNPALRSKLLRILARRALSEGRHVEARNLIERALMGVDSATSDASFRKAHFEAYQIYKALGENALALRQIEAVRRLDAADAEITASNRAALISGQFQFAAQNARIARLQAEQLRRDIEYQRTFTLIIGSGSAIALTLLGALLVLAIRSRNRARRDGAELAIVNQQLERALAAKTEFLASTSHELRTPLNGILGMTQIMLADQTLSTSMRAQVDLVHDAGTTMRALVDDILDVAKIEHGGFVITPRETNVAILATRVTRLFESQSSARGVALSLDVAALPDVPVMIDPDRMTQILFNLVGNALKFTHEGRVGLRLSVEGAESNEPQLRLDVTDNGIGIAPEWQTAIFDMFRQVDGTRTRQHGGTGLGLSICRQLARAMGGDISVTSEVGQGSCFTVLLPWIAVSASIPVTSGSAVQQDPVFAPGSVAVVATDPMRGAILSAMVRHAGANSTIVDTVEQIVLLADAKDILCLVDHQALHHVASALQSEQTKAMTWIIVGEGEDDVPTSIGMSATRVAFARNAVVEAVTQATVPFAAQRENSCLHQPLAIANANADANLGNESARRMSGF